jgi:hypothetical protein
MLSITELLLLLTTVSLVSIVSVRLYIPQTHGGQTQTHGEQIQQPIIIESAGRGDDRYTRAPRPQRMWDNGPEIPVRKSASASLSFLQPVVRGTANMLDPIPTRGAPEAYQQMGVMVGPDGKPLPLYGRRTAPRSDKFNYYTRTDSYNPVALPVTFNSKDCQDNAGCNELSSGDSIRISPTGESAKVTLYGFDGPRYSPDI